MQIIILQKRGEKVKKIVKLLMISLFLLTFLTRSYAQGIGWYCVRAKDHIQPTLDSGLRMAEDYDVYWIDKNHTSMDEEKVIYLTFDLGYENGNVEKIVDLLNKENVKANFFVLENVLLKNKSLIEKITESGHLIANHTAHHKDMTTLKTMEEFKSELESLEEIYKREYGKEMPKLYRPPEGKFNEENLKWAKELGYKTVMWSFAYADWDNDRQMLPEKAKKKILDNIHNGEIMLMHPTSSTNAEIMEDLVIELKNQGFRFATLDELCV